jgi:DNA-binding transcriptional MerR regulator
VEPLYSITQLADDVGATPRAIRLYEAKGLIRPQRAGATRVYTRRDRARLILILRGKRLGFSLAEIQEWLALYQPGPAQAAQLRLLVERVRDRVAALKRQQADLRATLAELREIERATLAHLASLRAADEP